MTTSVSIELAAIRKISAALEQLDDQARQRVISWMRDRYGHRWDIVRTTIGVTQKPEEPTE